MWSVHQERGIPRQNKHSSEATVTHRYNPAGAGAPLKLLQPVENQSWSTGKVGKGRRGKNKLLCPDPNLLCCRDRVRELFAMKLNLRVKLSLEKWQKMCFIVCLLCFPVLKSLIKYLCQLITN